MKRSIFQSFFSGYSDLINYHVCFTEHDAKRSRFNLPTHPFFIYQVSFFTSNPNLKDSVKDCDTFSNPNLLTFVNSDKISIDVDNIPVIALQILVY